MIAQCVLDATYEATLWAAAIEQAEGRGSGKVYLTFIGGGVFGNDQRWIDGAIARVSCRCRCNHPPTHPPVNSAWSY